MNARAQTAARVAMAVIALLVGIVLTSHLFGAKILGCGLECGTAQSQWFSPIFIAGILGFSFADIYLLVTRQDELYAKAAYWQAAAAGLAFAISVAQNNFCPLCLSVQLIWAAMALEVAKLRAVKILGYGFALGGLFTLINASTLNARTGTPTKFTFRPYEGRIFGSPAAIIVFSDPLCPYCRRDAQRMNVQRVPLPVLYRWKLLPQHGPEATRIAMFIEAANEANFSQGRQLLKAIFSGPPDPSRTQLIAAAKIVGFDGADATDWLDHPPADAVLAVRQDGDLADSLGLTKVPTPCAVDTVSAQGGPPAIRALTPRAINALTSMGEQDFSELNIFFE